MPRDVDVVAGLMERDAAPLELRRAAVAVAAEEHQTLGPPAVAVAKFEVAGSAAAVASASAPKTFLPFQGTCFHRQNSLEQLGVPG